MPRPAPSDTVPAMLTPGEAVLNREAAELMGRDKIKQLNAAGLAKRGYELNDPDMGLHRAGERPDLIRQDMTAKAMGFLGDINGSPRPSVDMVTEQSIGMPLPANYRHYPGLNPRPAPLTLPGREYYDVPSVVPGLDSEEMAAVAEGKTPPTVYDKAAAHAADRQWAGKPVFAGAIEPVAPIKGDDMRKLQGYANGTEDAQLPPSVPPANRQAYIAGSPAWENPATGTGSYFRDRAQDLGLMDNGQNYKSPFKRVGPGDTAQLTKAGINKVGSSYAMTPGAVTGGKELTVHLGDSTSSPTTVGGITNVGRDFWGKQADLDAVTPTVAVGQTPAPYPKYGAQRSAVEQATSRLSAPAPHIDLLEQFNAGLGIQGFVNGTDFVDDKDEAVKAIIGPYANKPTATTPGRAAELPRNGQSRDEYVPQSGPTLVPMTPTDKAYVANREAGYGVVPALAKSWGDVIVSPAVKSMSNAVTGVTGLAKGAVKAGMAIPDKEVGVLPRYSAQASATEATKPSVQDHVAPTQLGGKLATELNSLVTGQAQDKADWNTANKWGRNVALNDVKNGEAVMKNDTGTYGYRQDEKGDLVKFDSNGNRVGVMGNVKSNPEGTKTFWKNMGYPGGPEEYRARKAADAEQAQLNRLMELSLNPPNDGTFTGAARARATQKYASDALDRMITSRDRNSAQQAETVREEARLKMMGDHYTATENIAAEGNQIQAARYRDEKKAKEQEGHQKAMDRVAGQWADLYENSKDPEAKSSARQRFLQMQTGAADLMKEIGIPITPDEIQSHHLYKLMDIDKKAKAYQQSLMDPAGPDWLSANTKPRSADEAYIRAVREILAKEAPPEYQ